MTDERLYDYSKGLNAPYWIQEIKTKKGTRLWYFATPMQLSFFIVFTFVFVAMLLFGGFILVPLAKFTHSISLLLYWYLPYKLAKFYTEYEPHGKKMHVFIGDYLIYFWVDEETKKVQIIGAVYGRKDQRHQLSNLDMF